MSDISASMADTVPSVSFPQSEQFSAPDADLTIQSADGVLFRLHKRYLETTTGGFAPAGFDSQNETIHLSETAATLELLFQFVYPARHPGLASTPFETLAPLAEAAEKYQVYAAMNVCQIRMMGVLPNHAEALMAYGVKHDYPEIMYAAAPLLLDKPLENVLAEFPPVIAIAWTRYHATWSTCVRSAMLRIVESFKNTHKYEQISQSQGRRYDGCYCGQPLDRTVAKILTELANGVESLKDLSWADQPNLTCCDRLRPIVNAWRLAVNTSIANIPDFSTFV